MDSAKFIQTVLDCWYQALERCATCILCPGGACSAGTSSGKVGPFITDVVQVCKQPSGATAVDTETTEAHYAGTCWLQSCMCRLFFLAAPAVGACAAWMFPIGPSGCTIALQPTIDLAWRVYACSVIVDWEAVCLLPAIPSKGAPPVLGLASLIPRSHGCMLLQDFPAQEPGVYYNVSTLGAEFVRPLHCCGKCTP